MRNGERLSSGPLTQPPDGFRVSRETGLFVRLSGETSPVERSPFPSGLRRGPVALIADSTPLLRRIATDLDRRDLGCSFALVPDEAGRPSFAAALDAAARHPDIASILVAVRDLDHPDAFAAVARRAARHLPIVYASYRGDDSPFRRPWLERLGLVVARCVGDAIDAMPLLVDLDPLAGRSCCLISRSEGLGRHLCARIAAAGLEVERRVERGTEALDEALASTAWDCVVVVVEEPPVETDRAAAIDRITEARARHREIPCIVVADGSKSWAPHLRRHLALDGVPVLESERELESGLAALLRWSALREQAGAAKERAVRDTGRLRKTLRGLRSTKRSCFDPTVQGELLGALGLPARMTCGARYLEDSLIAATALGYPVWIAPHHLGQGWGREPRWQRVDGSDELMRAAQMMLAEAQRNAPGLGELLLAAAPKSIGSLRVEASRHPELGPVVTAACGAARYHGVIPIDATSLSEALSLTDRFGSATPIALEGATSAARAAAGLLGECADAAAVSLHVEVLTGGYLAHDISIRLRDP